MKYNVKMTVKWKKWHGMSVTETITRTVTADKGDHEGIRTRLLEDVRKTHLVPPNQDIVVLSYKATPAKAS